VALFFISSRYRLPLLLPLAAGSGFAIDALWKAVKARNRKLLVVAAAALVPLAFLAWRRTGIDEGRTNEETEMILWEIEAGHEAAAREQLARLEPRHPLPGVLWFRAGRAWLETRRPEEAAEAAGIALAKVGRETEAIPLLVEACRLSPSRPSAHQNLATLLAEAGRYEEARARAEEALSLKPDYAQAEALLKALDVGR
jgi:tetratricopeptide (TPR) repeat protein